MCLDEQICFRKLISCLPRKTWRSESFDVHCFIYVFIEFLAFMINVHILYHILH